jgi:hypothetical protein
MAISLQLIAGVDVGDRQREEDEADRQHDDVHHGNAPSKNASLPAGDTFARDANLIRIKMARTDSVVHGRLGVTNGIGIRDEIIGNVIGIP